MPDGVAEREVGRAPGGGPAPERRVLLVSTNYAPEQAGIGPYATQLAEHWAADGRTETHVLAGLPHYPAWRVDPAYRGVWRTVEERRGVRVHRRRHVVPRRQSAGRRALYEASILVGGIAAPPRMGRPDAVVAQLPSLAGGLLGARIARRYGVPFLPVVQDLMGAAAAQSGIRGGGRAAAVARAVEGRLLRRARLVGVIHESFLDRLTAMGVPRDRLRVVPNWTHITAPTRPRDQTRARLGWDDGRTVVLHSGNMGLKQGLEVLLEAARRDPGLHVVLMGEGSQRARLRELAGGTANVTFLPPAEEADFPEVLAAADVLAVTQRASVLDMSVPSKLTSYFAAGRPVLASVAAAGGTAGEVRRSAAGVLVPPEDPQALLTAVRELAADPRKAGELGARGLCYAEERLGREAGLARVTALLDEALAAAARHRPPGTTTAPSPQPPHGGTTWRAENEGRAADDG
ncbi:glycosyltransferase family 4 protein [Streptomyces sp. TP-A0874]|uniref:glycosyltransferase family 4 protein n=1 Tax=Streptomyces sp. TP-A0874 TaxID=549819 RepID=UPI00085326C8|nr:glycosyltransferase family 4 protein [Streptomyces sp. TP-A0874]